MEYNYNQDIKDWEDKYGRIKYLNPGAYKKNNITEDEIEDEE